MVISKGKLKSKMLEYFREVERTGEPLIVTDHGRHVLEVRPVARKKLSMSEALEWYRMGGTFVQKCTDEELMSAGENWEKFSEDTDFESL
jgi:antitoxin (DNA-binding transcriptional repressor) of toxin-antitoxin stability system